MEERSISQNDLLKIFKRFEDENNQTIACIGSIGSQVNGLMVNKSDLDFRVITSTPIEKGFFYSIDVDGFAIEAIAYDWLSVKSELLKWVNCERKYPSICSDIDSDLVHNDIIRSQIRLCLSHPLYFNEKCFSLEDKNLIQKGLLIIDGIDYEYSRAYMNFEKSLQEDRVSTRKYLYTINEIFSILWLLKNGTVPPSFLELLDLADVGGDVKSEIQILFELNKTAPKESNYVDRNMVLNNYIESQLSYLNKVIADYSFENGSEVYRDLHYC